MTGEWGNLDGLFLSKWAWDQLRGFTSQCKCEVRPLWAHAAPVELQIKVHVSEQFKAKRNTRTTLKPHLLTAFRLVVNAATAVR